MQWITARVFEATDGAGLARFDFFFTGTELVADEMNTMPGFTPISTGPTCWLVSAMTYPKLIGELIELGMSTIR